MKIWDPDDRRTVYLPWPRGAGHRVKIWIARHRRAWIQVLRVIGPNESIARPPYLLLGRSLYSHELNDPGDGAWLSEAWLVPATPRGPKVIRAFRVSELCRALNSSLLALSFTVVLCVAAFYFDHRIDSDVLLGTSLFVWAVWTTVMTSFTAATLTIQQNARLIRADDVGLHELVRSHGDDALVRMADAAHSGLFRTAMKKTNPRSGEQEHHG